MFPGVNKLYSTTKYIYSTFFLSLSQIMLGGSPFSICLWCCDVGKCFLYLQCPIYLMPAVACVADIADNLLLASLLVMNSLLFLASLLLLSSLLLLCTFTLVLTSLLCFFYLRLLPASLFLKVSLICLRP
jgi:hypothetical protein